MRCSKSCLFLYPQVLTEEDTVVITEEEEGEEEVLLEVATGLRAARDHPGGAGQAPMVPYIATNQNLTLSLPMHASKEMPLRRNSSSSMLMTKVRPAQEEPVRLMVMEGTVYRCRGRRGNWVVVSSVRHYQTMKLTLL